MKFYVAFLILLIQNNSFGLAKVRTDCGLYLCIFGHSFFFKSLNFLACGESNTRTGGRIVNGRTTIPNKYPWIAGMFTPTAFMCGGAIISDRNILTAGKKNFLTSLKFRSGIGNKSFFLSRSLRFLVSSFYFKTIFILTFQQC